MSRQVFLILLLVPSAALGQPIERADRTFRLMENARQLAAVDADGCLLHRADDEIVVCGIPELDRQQRLPFPNWRRLKVKGSANRYPEPIRKLSSRAAAMFR